MARHGQNFYAFLPFWFPQMCKKNYIDTIVICGFFFFCNKLFLNL